MWDQLLDARRRELGMTIPALAARSSVKPTTVKRILGGRAAQASLCNVLAVANALGLDVEVVPRTSVMEMREQEAKRKAKLVVRAVQATSGLESQAVNAAQAEDMYKQTVHELMGGSKRRLWNQ